MVNLYENKDQMLNDSIDRVVVELVNRKKSDKAEILMLTGCSSLSGTTTISIALAIALANTGRKVLLMDCDIRKFSKYKKHSKEISCGLVDYLEQNMRLESVVEETNIKDLYYLAGGVCDENVTRLLCSEKMRELFKLLKEQYDFVLLDMPSVTVLPDACALMDDVDGVILLSSLGETTKSQIKLAKRKLSKWADKYYGMIVNKVSSDEFKSVVRGYDYYFKDKKGNQNLTKRLDKNTKG